MRLRQIEVFHAVFVTGSVSGGARALNVSQPTVSKVLRHTEDQLGFELFIRKQGRLFPTEKGETLFVEIEPLFKQLSDLKKFTVSLGKEKSGRLKFAMTPAFGLEIAPTAVASYSRQNPDVTFEVETLHSEQVANAVLNGTADIGLVFDAPRIPGLVSRRLCATDLICVAPAGENLANGKAVSLKDLDPHRLITLNEKSVLGQLLNRKLTDAHRGALDSRVITETYHVAKRIVRKGGGIAIIDTITAYSGDVSGISFHAINPPIPINIDLIMRDAQADSGALEEFAMLLRQIIDAFLADKILNM